MEHKIAKWWEPQPNGKIHKQCMACLLLVGDEVNRVTIRAMINEFGVRTCIVKTEGTSIKAYCFNGNWIIKH